MSSFTKGPGFRTPFGQRQFLRSTQDVKTRSATLAKTGVPSVTVDGVATKVVQPGSVLAKITSGADSGKVGLFQASATDGRQTAANIVGLCNTFLPWQLLERDVEVAVVYEASVVEAWCKQRAADGTETALSAAVVAWLSGTPTAVSPAAPGDPVVFTTGPARLIFH